MGFQQIYRWGVLSLALQLIPFPAQANSLCPAQIQEAIATITHEPQFRRAHWGILVQSLEQNAQPQTLYAENAAQYFIPASNAKLLTTAAALEQLGPEFRIRTSVYQITDRTNKIILRIVGRGDPSFTDAELRNLAKQIADSGIAHIDQLILDNQYFRGDPINSTWEWEDIQAGYGAPVTSLILNENAIELRLVPQKLGQPLQVQWEETTAAQSWQVVNHSSTVAADAPEFLTVGRDFSQPILQVAGQLRVGSEPEPVAVSIPQPVSYFGDRFAQALTAAGLQVDRIQTATETLPSAAVEIAAVESPTLSALLRETNQESNNLYAEALLRLLGAGSNQSSLEAGLASLQASLNRLGIDANGYQLADGSGLSRHNLISPEAIVQTLEAMARSPYAMTYRNSLSVAGISGTLRNRFQGSAVEGRFQGKTGFLSGTTALSGYLEPQDYSPLVLSILVNQSDLALQQVRQAMDDIVEKLANLQRC